MRIFKRRKEHASLETLSEYLDGRLSATDTQEVKRHLELCTRCSEELSSLELTVGLLRKAPAVAPRRTFTLQEPLALAPVPLGVRAPAWAYGAAASVAIVLFALVLSADLSGTLAGEGSTPGASRQTTEASLAPTPLPEDGSSETQQAAAAVVKEVQVEKEIIKEVAAPREVEVKEVIVEKEVVREVAAAREAPVEKEVVKEVAAPREVQVEKEVAKDVAAAREVEVEKEIVREVEKEVAAAAEVKDAAEPAKEPSQQIVAADSAAATPASAPSPEDVQKEVGVPTLAAKAVPPQAADPGEGELHPAPTPKSLEERDALSLPKDEQEGEALPAPTPETSEEFGVLSSPEDGDGSTANVWHVLEGVLGGLALALVGGILWRVRRLRRPMVP